MEFVLLCLQSAKHDVKTSKIKASDDLAIIYIAYCTFMMCLTTIICHYKGNMTMRFMNKRHDPKFKVFNNLGIL